MYQKGCVKLACQTAPQWILHVTVLEMSQVPQEAMRQWWNSLYFKGFFWWQLKIFFVCLFYIICKSFQILHIFLLFISRLGEKKKEMDHKLDHAATSMFWEGRMTGYLVLFWYLSLGNAYRYSDPSVWEGSFIDEVRLLTAMKQNLKQIKRHFSQLYPCFFQLAQVLHI